MKFIYFAIDSNNWIQISIKKGNLSVYVFLNDTVEGYFHS